MESESEERNDISSFLDTVDRMQADMKKLVKFAEKLKRKEDEDMLFQGMSVFTKFGVENSEGPLSTEDLIMLLKMISENEKMDQALSRIKDYKDVEKIKKQLQYISKTLKDKTKDEKVINDKLIKKISEFIKIFGKRPQLTQGQSLINKHFLPVQQKKTKNINPKDGHSGQRMTEKGTENEVENSITTVTAQITTKKFKSK